MNVDLEKCLACAVEIAKTASSMIVSSTETRKDSFNVYEKGNVDFVTDSDRAVEKFIFGKLKAAFPDYCFIGFFFPLPIHQSFDTSFRRRNGKYF